jgi:hypothetical protein
MGTFHDNPGELHGITVVVDTPDGRLYVGRCHEANDEQVVLLDVDVHEDGATAQSREDYLRRAAAVGVWRKHPRLVLPRTEVTSVRRLVEFRAG